MYLFEVACAWIIISYIYILNEFIKKLQYIDKTHLIPLSYYINKNRKPACESNKIEIDDINKILEKYNLADIHGQIEDIIADYIILDSFIVI